MKKIDATVYVLAAVGAIQTYKFGSAKLVQLKANLKK